VGETGTDGEELPPWPPVSPAVTDLSEAEPDSEADTGELPLVPAAPESAVATAPPLDATLPPDATRPPDATPPERNLTRLAILGGLTVLLIIAAMLGHGSGPSSRAGRAGHDRRRSGVQHRGRRAVRVGGDDDRRRAGGRVRGGRRPVRERSVGGTR